MNYSKRKSCGVYQQARLFKKNFNLTWKKNKYISAFRFFIWNVKPQVKNEKIINNNDINQFNLHL